MPIYEFYCPKCHMVFNFFSQSINTEKLPKCPHCGGRNMQRQMSTFSLSNKKGDEDMGIHPSFDEKN